MQTRLQSFFEAVINVVIGYGIATVANYFVIPLFSHKISVGDAAGIGLIFTVISVIRSYVLRRFFNWLHR